VNRWLARLAFSFLIIAAVFAYEGNKRHSTPHYVAAAIFLMLGAVGIRERHRS
jgi:hypothetical protein